MILSQTAIDLIYIPLALVSLVLTVLTMARHRDKNLAASYMVYMLMVLGWQMSELLLNNADDFGLAYFLFDLKLPFVALTSLCSLLYVLHFYGLDTYVSGPITVCLAVTPMVTFALALTPHWHDYLRVGLRIIQTEPALIVNNVRGPWFWVHAGYCYLLILMSMVAALARHRSLPKLFKHTSLVLIAGMGISMGLNLLHITGILTLDIDYAMVGATVCGLFMYIATRENQGMDYINRARAEVFNTLGDGMLILDSERNVRGFNQSGRGFMIDCGMDDETGSFEQILDTIHSAAWKVEVSQDEEGGTDYYIEDCTYNIRERVIHDNHQRDIGALIVASNVTDNRRLIRRLEVDAGMDALTGLFNRMKMDEMTAKLDRPDNYPLAVIMGDLNGLKQVNDTYGHQQGDVLLRLAAEILSAVCPPNACIGRIGGDEFLILIPGYPLERAQMLMGGLGSRMAATQGYRYEVSMALGGAVKESDQQNIGEVIRLADTKMYVRKELYKTARENRRSVRAGGGLTD